MRGGVDIILGCKGNTPPQLWTLLPQMDGPPELEKWNINFHQSIKITGPGYFSGHLDRMIVCTGTDGEIVICDRETGLVLFQASAGVPDVVPRPIACIPSSQNTLTIATTEKRHLKIWTTACLYNSEHIPP
ncbi:hypothetical protein BDZ94DRAFT_188522 [Collybia nuda]|uniref:Uncharacterized protein n=1 Tax=Collybia nuda TaxID=64659 RepID=A0A9P5XVF6_9AGAR|nr:hypothetical protein BDZ94DRAFT_188522 [Collybia nuda]